MTNTDEILKILQQKQISSCRKEGILVAAVPDQKSGLSLANDLLLHLVNPQTLLLLSGGRTPWALYEMIASEKKLRPGAMAMVDERYGPKWHDNSNEKNLRRTGLLEYYQYTSIPVYLVLQSGLSRQETATAYEKKLRELFSSFAKKIGLLGIGLDGHTAGIPSSKAKFKRQKSKLFSDQNLVAEYSDTSGSYGERVTMTLTALSQLDLLIVLIFGDDKKKALELVFSDGREEEIPGRFYTRPEIAKKTLFITDQKV